MVKLKESDMISLELTRLRWDITVVFKYLKGFIKKMEKHYSSLPQRAEYMTMDLNSGRKIGSNLREKNPQKTETS